MCRVTGNERASHFSSNATNLIFGSQQFAGVTCQLTKCVFRLSNKNLQGFFFCHHPSFQIKLHALQPAKLMSSTRAWIFSVGTFYSISRTLGFVVVELGGEVAQRQGMLGPCGTQLYASRYMLPNMQMLHLAWINSFLMLTRNHQLMAGSSDYSYLSLHNSNYTLGTKSFAGLFTAKL